MAKPNTVELRFRIWDDVDGCRIEVGDDSDALDMLEIVAVDFDGKRSGQFVYIREEDAEAVASSILKVAEHIRNRKNG